MPWESRFIQRYVMITVDNAMLSSLMRLKWKRLRWHDDVEKMWWCNKPTCFYLRKSEYKYIYVFLSSVTWWSAKIIEKNVSVCFQHQNFSIEMDRKKNQIIQFHVFFKFGQMLISIHIGWSYVMSFVCTEKEDYYRQNFLDPILQIPLKLF